MTCLDTSPPDTAGLDSTVVTAANPAELSPLEAAIMDLCNALHEARLEQSGIAAEIERDLFELLERYEGSSADEHPNPAWAIPNQRALALSAAGRLDQAIQELCTEITVRIPHDCAPATARAVFDVCQSHSGTTQFFVDIRAQRAWRATIRT
ncbi:MAG: hypothetical protein IH985_09215, partial [Planctomycetes bacterium]|nr:hypothetical protein [Planctomycetota bacterium]